MFKKQGLFYEVEKSGFSSAVLAVESTSVKKNSVKNTSSRPKNILLTSSGLYQDFHGKSFLGTCISAVAFWNISELLTSSCTKEFSEIIFLCLHAFPNEGIEGTPVSVGGNEGGGAGERRERGGRQSLSKTESQNP